MKRFCAMLVLMLALGLATNSALSASKKSEADYSGVDGGYLIYAVGTIRIGMHFEFPYRRLSDLQGEPAEAWKGKITPKMGGAFTLKNKDPDFEGFETGRVVVRRLPPGRYVINDFAFAGSSPTGSSYHWNSGMPFAIEFTIEPGKATYIGSFMRSPTPPRPALRAVLGYAGYFLVADRSERDLPIARQRFQGDVPIMVQVTDVEEFGSPSLRNHSLE